MALKRNKNNRVFRVIGSGRNKLATITGEDALLEGDVSVEIDSLPKNLLIECKHRKSNSKITKSLALRKEWCDQALHEAMKEGRWSVVVIKFKGVPPNSKKLKKYCWADGHFGNTVQYIIPESHFKEILLSIEKANNASIINKEDTLRKINDDELLEEVQKRLSRRKVECLNVGKQNGDENNSKNTESS